MSYQIDGKEKTIDFNEFFTDMNLYDCSLNCEYGETCG